MTKIKRTKVILLASLIVLISFGGYKLLSDQGKPIQPGDDLIAVRIAASFPGLTGLILKEGIYLITPDGSELTPVVEQRHVTQSTWSPQGDKIVFDGYNGLYMVTIDSSDQPELLWPGSVTLNPSWSPEGSSIAFADNQTVQILDLESRNTIELIDPKYSASDPDWSPDGLKIVLTLRPGYFEKDGPEQSIGVINIDGSNLTQLTPNDGSQLPKWSPDGQRIVFQRDDNIYVMNTDGSNIRALTNDNKSLEPDWSSDGTKIIFVSFKNSRCGPSFADGFPFCTSELYMMNADGSNKVMVSSKSNESIGWPAWAPRLETQ